MEPEKVLTGNKKKKTSHCKNNTFRRYAQNLINVLIVYFYTQMKHTKVIIIIINLFDHN